jgi:hypothetical protein
MRSLAVAISEKRARMLSTPPPLPEDVANALEAARRVAFAFRPWSTPNYIGRWDDDLPQHEALIALGAALAKVDVP